MNVSKKIVLKFPPDLVDKSIIYHLVKDYDLTFNVLKASINPRQEGTLVMELSGDKKQYGLAMEFLKNEGVRVDPLIKDVARREERCTHCGACVTVCPVAAFVSDPKTRKIEFYSHACIACGLCIPACPVSAMEVRL